MDDLTVYQDASGRIAELFEISSTEIEMVDAVEYLKRLRQILADRIEYMLGHEKEHLKWVLYRIDVSEQKVDRMLAELQLHEAVEGIADLIIARQVEKAITRKRYSTGSGEMSFDI